MITNVSIVSVFVKDIDESLKFYTDVLGFDAGADVTLGDGYRWCTVVHPNQPELHLHLTTPGPPMDEELKAKGVEFIQEPAERPYGVEALLRDNSGNWMVLVEQKMWRPEDFE